MEEGVARFQKGCQQEESGCEWEKVIEHLGPRNCQKDQKGAMLAGLEDHCGCFLLCLNLVAGFELQEQPRVWHVQHTRGRADRTVLASIQRTS